MFSRMQTLVDPELQEVGKFIGELGRSPHWGPEAKTLVTGQADDNISESNFLTQLSHKVRKFRLHGERVSTSAPA